MWISFEMSSSDRIELSVDSGTWGPMGEDMVSIDPFGSKTIEPRSTNTCIVRDHLHKTPRSPPPRPQKKIVQSTPN